MRKAPTQQRAQATVQAILQAAAHILGRRGWMKFTTNEVAEAAGVSIGSLYQYRQRYRSVIAQASGRRRSSRDDTAARVLAGAVEGVVHAAARHGELGSPQLRRELAVDVFNLFDRQASDIDYAYTSRLRGEAAAGVGDIHFHPVEPRSVRLTLTANF